MSTTKQPPTKSKYVYNAPIACFRSGIVDDQSYGVLVLIAGHQDHHFGYYIAGERQVGNNWVYQVYDFIRRTDEHTYATLLKSIMAKQAETKVANT